LNEERLREIVKGIRNLHVLVVGDLFLDKYLIVDTSLSGRSLETGLEVYQVTEKRLLPGAAGTVAKALRALGASVSMLTVIGQDGEGTEVKESLARLDVLCDHVFVDPSLATPTYIKLMIMEKDQLREIRRIDIKNRRKITTQLEEKLCEALHLAATHADAVIISDQVTEPDCGVITSRMRKELLSVARLYPGKAILADSRARIAEFVGLVCKPNHHEARCALGDSPREEVTVGQLIDLGKRLQAVTGKLLFVTAGEHGIVAARADGSIHHVPSFPARSPIDVVGAGDSVLSALTASLSVGCTAEEAAWLGCLVGSLVVEQVGTTGEATPKMILNRFRQLNPV